MTRKLEDLFDLPRDMVDEPMAVPAPNEISIETLENIDKIEAALPQVRGLDASDNEMDELASMATESYKDLINLGMNVEARYSSEILAVASNMLGHAITAKTAKLNKKLKMVDLQMKKLALDRRSDTGVATTTAEGVVIDRNDLLRRVLDNSSKKE
jgi:hypothetical protein